MQCNVSLDDPALLDANRVHGSTSAQLQRETSPQAFFCVTSPSSSTIASHQKLLRLADRHRQFGAEADVALDLVVGDLAGLEHDPGSFSFSRTAEPTATGIAPTPSGLRCVAENGRGRLVEPPTSGGQREVADSESYGRSR
ncbi:hypothetical protein [Mesorhizobium sp. M7A.F.Ca.MR.362.00.0.0]|uniref:hypothetical protein n=1 Tax=Mesorhizobium sp. M7A.F.Ca.MR.362.00.0.0 TaxID=2496779 RepID=UPI0013E384B7|nr:hypothetical protein [Mesorhizobium sp. M7A.F.Ca.MR.362.00.0.0]